MHPQFLSGPKFLSAGLSRSGPVLHPGLLVQGCACEGPYISPKQSLVKHHPSQNQATQQASGRGVTHAGQERRATVQLVWEVLGRVLDGAGPRPKPAALVSGSRSYLESGHAAFLQQTIQANRAQVCTIHTMTGGVRCNIHAGQ